MTNIAGLVTYIAGLMTYIAGLVTYIAGLVTYIAGLVTYIAGCLTGALRWGQEEFATVSADTQLIDLLEWAVYDGRFTDGSRLKAHSLSF